MDIVIVEPFDATELVLSFVGTERVHMEVPMRAVKDFHRETKEIVKMQIVMTEYTQEN